MSNESTSQAANDQTALPAVLNTHMTFGNFDITNAEVEEVVNAIFLADTSISMEDYKDELNAQIKFCVEKIQSFHQKDIIYLSTGRFDHEIEVLTGFQPVEHVKSPKFNPKGTSTRLYDATLEFLRNAINCQRKAASVGIITKTILFVMTDGKDNDSHPDAANEIKSLLNEIKNDEGLSGSFMTALCGIGEPAGFKAAQKAMGFQKLFVVDPNQSEDENKEALRKVFGWFSSSISSASTNKGALII